LLSKEPLWVFSMTSWTQDRLHCHFPPQHRSGRLTPTIGSLAPRDCPAPAEEEPRLRDPHPGSIYATKTPSTPHPRDLLQKHPRALNIVRGGFSSQCDLLEARRGCLVCPATGQLLRTWRGRAVGPRLPGPRHPERAHYHARPPRPAGTSDGACHWSWSDYLTTYSRRLRRGRRQLPAASLPNGREPRSRMGARRRRGSGRLRALAGLGLADGVVSNSQTARRRRPRPVGRCYGPDGDGPQPEAQKKWGIRTPRWSAWPRRTGIFRIEWRPCAYRGRQRLCTGDSLRRYARGRGARRGQAADDMDP